MRLLRCNKHVEKRVSDFSCPCVANVQVRNLLLIKHSSQRDDVGAGSYVCHSMTKRGLKEGKGQRN